MTVCNETSISQNYGPSSHGVQQPNEQADQLLQTSEQGSQPQSNFTVSSLHIDLADQQNRLQMVRNLVNGFEQSASQFLDTINEKRQKLFAVCHDLTLETRILQMQAIDQDQTTYELLLGAIEMYKAILEDVEANTMTAASLHSL
jgi:small-conductance mechanosensitive channel